MSPNETRKYSGIALVVVLAVVGCGLFITIRNAESAASPMRTPLVPPAGTNVKPISTGGRSSIDIVTQAADSVVSGAPIDVPIDPKKPASVTGWAVDGPNDALASKVYVVIDGTTWLPAAYGEDRRDVATALGAPAVARCGFRGTIPPGTLANGRHSLAIAVVDAAGTHYYSDFSNATLVVGG